MATLLEQLQSQVEKSREILAATELELPTLQDWLGHRAMVFVELEELDSHCPAEKPALLTAVIEELMAIDARILARLEKQLGELGEKIAAANKVGRAVSGSCYSHPAELVSRLA